MPAVFNSSAATTDHYYVKMGATRGLWEQAIQATASDIITVFAQPLSTGIRSPIWSYTNDINTSANFFSCYFGTDEEVIFAAQGTATTILTAVSPNSASKDEWSQIVVNLSNFSINLDDNSTSGTATGALPTGTDYRYLYLGAGQTTNFSTGAEFGRVKVAGLAIFRDRSFTATDITTLYNGATFSNPLDHPKAGNASGTDAPLGAFLAHCWHLFDDRYNHYGIHQFVQATAATDVTETDQPYTVFPTAVAHIEDDYGASDNGADAATSWNDAIADLNSDTIKTLECNGSATYTVATGLADLDATGIVIRGKGCTIKAATGLPVSSGNQIFQVSRSVNFTIKDLNIDGNRSNRTSVELDAHNMHIEDSNQGFFANVNCKEAVVDGWYLNWKSDATSADDEIPRELRFGNCGATKAWRNNVSIIAARDCYWQYGDMLGATGTGPEDGIDFEPNSGNATDGVVNFHFYWNDLKHNHGYAVGWIGNQSGFNNVINCTINFADIQDNTGQTGFTSAEALFSQSQDSGIVDSYIFDSGSSTDARGVIDFAAEADNTNCFIDRCRFESHVENHLGIFYLHSVNGGGHTSDSCEFFNYTVPLTGGEATKITITNETDDATATNQGDNRPVIADPDTPNQLAGTDAARSPHGLMMLG